jgi:predicted lipoprotein with Yx(FWY)xxD motif
MRNRWWAALVLAGGAAVLAACGSPAQPASSSQPAVGPPASHASSSSATVTIMTRTTSKGVVLTNAQGQTIYWFAIDTPAKSNCTGSCLTYWPPVAGTPVVGSGASLSGQLGTITGSNGQVQATYDGHPLYTYKGDSSPGMVTGNGLNLSGGLWWAMTPTAAKLSS